MLTRKYREEKNNMRLSLIFLFCFYLWVKLLELVFLKKIKFYDSLIFFSFLASHKKLKTEKNTRHGFSCFVFCSISLFAREKKAWISKIQSSKFVKTCENQMTNWFWPQLWWSCWLVMMKIQKIKKLIAKYWNSTSGPQILTMDLWMFSLKYFWNLWWEVRLKI